MSADERLDELERAAFMDNYWSTTKSFAGGLPTPPLLPAPPS